MNKYIKSATALVLSITVLMSCSNFDEINTNPNTSNKVTSGMLATGMLISITKQGPEYGSFIDHNFLSKHAITAELIRDTQYNKSTRCSFGAYGNLRNVKKMVDNAADVMKPSYEALGLFLKAYQLFYLSLDCGDIPYKEALLGETEGITRPKYDSQKDVVLQILADLDRAALLFETARNFDGDPIFNGNVKQWKKVTNAFKLKVLTHLYLHEKDAELKVDAKFADLISYDGLMESNNDNFQLVYANKGGQIYPFNELQARSINYCILSSNLVDSLKAFQDHRLFYFAEPSQALLNAGKNAGEFDAYSSINPALPFDEITKLYGDKEYTNLNKRYTDKNNPAGEPIIRVGYAEQCFNIAEGIVRGWAPGNAREYYNKGVKAAMNFVKDHTPEAYVNGRPAITDKYIDDYLTKSKAAFSNDKETQLKQIFQQKYFIYFLQSPWDGYYEYRRVLYPKLPIDPSTNMNQVRTQLPKRWMYPQNEYDENSENITDALERQFGGRDDNNDLMWILKK